MRNDPEHTAMPSGKSLLYTILLLALGICCFFQAPSNGFVYDDTSIIRDNPLVQGELSTGRIFASNYWYAAVEKDPLYRPLTILSFALQNTLNAITPFAVLLLNVLLHIASATLLMRLLLRLQLSGFLSFATAALFLVAPIHVEVVANGVGRAELLSAFFSLLALEFFFGLYRGKSIGSSDPQNRYPRSRYPRFGLLLSMCCYLFALLSKESAILLPLILIAIDCLFHTQKDVEDSEASTESAAERISAYCFVAIGAALYLALRYVVVGLATPSAHELLRPLSVSQRLALASETMLHYIQQTLIRFQFAADYHDYSQLSIPTLFSEGALLAPLTILALLLATVAATLLKQRVVALAGIWFFLALLPTSNVLIPIGVLQADRLAYFPSIGICLLIASFFSLLFRVNRPTAFVLLAAYLGLQVFHTQKLVPVWKSKASLWEHTKAVNPGSAEAWRNLGDVHLESKEYAEAIAAFKEAKRLRAQHGRFDRGANLRLAKAYQLIGDTEEAASFHIEILRRNPRHLVAAISLGQLYLEDPALYADALRAFEHASQQHPNNPHALAHKAEALKRLKRQEEALESINQAIALRSPRPAWPYMLAIKIEVLRQLGRNEEANRLTEKRENLKKSTP